MLLWWLNSLVVVSTGWFLLRRLDGVEAPVPRAADRFGAEVSKLLASVVDDTLLPAARSAGLRDVPVPFRERNNFV